MGSFRGTLIKRRYTVGWGIAGLLVAVMVERSIFGPHTLTDPEAAFGLA
jgi:hypothetical protein